MLFLFCFAVPAILFCLAILISSLARDFNFWRIAEALAIYLLIWTAINGAVYIVYAQLMQLPQPAFREALRQVSRFITWRRFLRAVYVLLLLGACYAVYPRAYFYYQVSKAEVGNLDKQLWVARTYAAPYTKRFLGDRTSYIPQSDAKARDWFEKAAAQNSVEAYNRLSGLYMGNYQLVKLGESRTHLEIARDWAQKALNYDQVDRIEKLIAARPTKRSLYAGNNHTTDFSTMSDSPVYSSSGWQNLLATICWLIGGGFLNIGIFYTLSRVLNQRYHQHIVFVAISWPIYLCLAYILANLIFFNFDVSNLSEYV
ncbi:MAG TPA: hypothetical protein VHP34_11730, partial [Alphaproteobacteria bacterium]|nr:hypothetical protein [Alphaproteobacteria bacterium]